MPIAALMSIWDPCSRLRQRQLNRRWRTHKTLIPQVIEELKKLGRPDIMVTAGGVIPAQDYDFLYKAGVAAIFGPGTPVAYSAKVVMQLLMQE